MAKSKTPPAGGRKPNHKMLSRTLFVLIVCGIVAFFALGIQLFNVMILKHDEYESGAIAQQVRRKEVTAMRGTIYDRNGKILAQSATRETVILSPADIRKNDEDAAEICRELVEVLGDKYGVTYEDLMKKAQKTDSYYEIVTRRIDPEEADALRAYKEEHECTGIWLAPDSKRYYPYGSLASHVIGFVGLDNNGLAGVESEYDNALSGSTGRIVRAADGQGTGILLVRYEDYSAAAAGQDVTLTLDATIQYYMEKQLKQAVEDYDVQNGAAAIAMDPNTGAILGMASLGNFDLNDYQAVDDKTLAAIEETESEEERQKLLSDAQQRMWRNKALSDTYEPGSTFKIITLSMALEEGVVSMDDTFPCGGSTMVRGRNEPLKCWKTTGHGSQTLTQAVQHSCNVAFVNIGQRVGAEKFYEYAENFGFLNITGDKDATLTARTGIDLAGESGSIWWSENTFYNPENLSQLASASFGQTFTITPLQLITAVSACVNGGYLMEPYVVREVTDPSGKILAAHEPTAVRQVISEETSAEVRTILEQVVGDPVDGTGKNAYVAGYRIGGKTGTSEKVAQDAAGGPKEYIVSFVGVAPADNPKIVILVLLDTPSNETGIYISGGQMGAPTVGKMLADILPYMGIDPAYSDAEKAYMDKTVPNVTGLTRSQAMDALQELGFNARIIGDGEKITSQLPGGATVVANGTTVLLYCDAEPSEEPEIMPDLTGYTYSAARDELAAMGIFITTPSSITNPNAQSILSQSVAAEEEIDHGTVVTVTLVTSDDTMLGRY